MIMDYVIMKKTYSVKTFPVCVKTITPFVTYIFVFYYVTICLYITSNAVSVKFVFGLVAFLSLFVCT